jgi:hypothetical protein
MVENRYATLSKELVDTDCTAHRSLGDSIKKENATIVKFDLEPVNLKKPQWASKMGKIQEEKFEFGTKDGLKPQGQVSVRDPNDG